MEWPNSSNRWVPGGAKKAGNLLLLIEKDDIFHKVMQQHVYDVVECLLMTINNFTVESGRGQNLVKLLTTECNHCDDGY